MLINLKWKFVNKMKNPNFIILGSVALKHHYPAVKRKPKDVDILVDKPEVFKGKYLDVQSHRLYSLISEYNKGELFASPEVLLTLKLSHVGKDTVWLDKTLKDIEFLLWHESIMVIEPLYKELVILWDEVRPSKVNLNKTNSEFFSDNVNRLYDHELLHELVAFEEEPMNYKIRPSLDYAYCSEELWDKLSFDEKCYTVLEESMVISIERFKLDPSSTRNLRLKAMEDSGKKLITTMSKGYFSRFIAENYYFLFRHKFAVKLYNEQFDKVFSNEIFLK